MKTGAKTKSITVRLTPRQHAALTAYTQSVDATVGGYARAVLTSNIPPEFWDREEVPPGQLTMAIRDVA